MIAATGLPGLKGNRRCTRTLLVLCPGLFQDDPDGGERGARYATAIDATNEYFEFH
jgi:hypothetical protein